MSFISLFNAVNSFYNFLVVVILKSNSDPIILNLLSISLNAILVSFNLCSYSSLSLTSISWLFYILLQSSLTAASSLFNFVTSFVKINFSSFAFDYNSSIWASFKLNFSFCSLISLMFSSYCLKFVCVIWDTIVSYSVLQQTSISILYTIHIFPMIMFLLLQLRKVVFNTSNNPSEEMKRFF